MIDIRKQVFALIERFKYPFLVLALGIMLMLIPSTSDSLPALSQSDTIVSDILSHCEGAGETMVLISDKGVVVVCQGADSARVKMEIIQALSSYTGFSSDKITILKMAD